MIGLVYKGDHEEGVRVMLYRSYKTVLIRPSKPYVFTKTDRTDKDAENYYNTLRKINIFPSNDTDELNIKISPIEDKRTQTYDAVEKAEEVVESFKEKVEESPSATNSDFSSMSDGELLEYLDVNFDEDKIKSIISETGMDISTKRKKKDSLISSIVESYKDQLISYLSK